MSEKTEIEVKGQVALFVVFFCSLCLLALVAKSVDFNTTLFGTELTKHVSDIMTEHEAGKSMFVLSMLALVLGYMKQILKWLGFQINPFLNRYLLLAPTNFLVSLIFVEMAVTSAVIVMAPKELHGSLDILVYLGGKNYTLGASIFISLAILHGTDKLYMARYSKLVMSLLPSSVYIWALIW